MGDPITRAKTKKTNPNQKIGLVLRKKKRKSVKFRLSFKKVRIGSEMFLKSLFFFLQLYYIILCEFFQILDRKIGRLEIGKIRKEVECWKLKLVKIG